VAFCIFGRNPRDDLRDDRVDIDRIVLADIDGTIARPADDRSWKFDAEFLAGWRPAAA
jgi:hypothetical protein